MVGNGSELMRSGEAVYLVTTLPLKGKGEFNKNSRTSYVELLCK